HNCPRPADSRPPSLHDALPICSGVLRLPDRLHAEPARAALRHRAWRPGAVGHADARPLVLELRVPQLELSPRASLLRGRAVLPPPGAAARARALLRAPADPLADLLGSGVRLARRKSRAAHELDDGARTHTRGPRCAGCRSS